ncbi:hypothetical protein ACFL1H_08305 [Nanoarchaeota archaeon]
MIYTPSDHPTEAFVLISIIVVVGIVGTLTWSNFFLLFALIFWIHYTAILSYLQFAKKKGEKKKKKGFTEFLLNPQVRFFIFVFIGVLGIGSMYILNTNWIGIGALGIWWLFALNFFVYYEDFIKVEN